MTDRPIWFRRRHGALGPSFGWTYIPVTWQGWALVVCVLACLTAAAVVIDPQTIGEALLFIAAAAAILIGFGGFAERRTPPRGDDAA
ncbi:hypothetical protein [Caenispirillum salinarum]|uniref:hypothetical protein n=1 Tax=Caenispirillum salinarum TaxID=859058 RepID=UPI00384DF6F3